MGILDEIPVVATDVPFRVLPPELAEGLFLSTLSFYRQLARYDHIDVMCYSTVHPNLTHPVKVNRLITVLYRPPRFLGAVPIKEIRYATNLHSKLYIGYSGRRATAYIGSDNFGPPSTDWLELMVRTNSKQTKVLVKYFNSIWKHLKQ